MNIFRQFWQKLLDRVRPERAPGVANDIADNLASITDENRTLHTDLDGLRRQLEQEHNDSSSGLAQIRQQVEQIHHDDAQSLAEMQQQVAKVREESMQSVADLQQALDNTETEREQMQQRVQMLQRNMQDASARQQAAEARTGKLEEELRKEHIRQMDQLNLLQGQVRSVEHSAGRSMWVAIGAMGLIAVSSSAMLWNAHNINRVLDTIGSDIQTITRTLARQQSEEVVVRQAKDEPVAAIAEDRDTLPPPVVRSAPPVVRSAPPAELTEMDASGDPLLEMYAAGEPEVDETIDLLSAPVINWNDYQSADYDSREGAQQFFADNALQPGVITESSGLQYRIVSQGSGRVPVASDRVKVSYRAFRVDGSEFSTSTGGADGSVFVVDEVIPAWKEALLQMEEGAQWELYVPSALAHVGGTRKRSMLGNTPHVYILELKSIVSDSANEPGQPPE